MLMGARTTEQGIFRSKLCESDDKDGPSLEDAARWVADAR